MEQSRNTTIIIEVTVHALVWALFFESINVPWQSNWVMLDPSSVGVFPLSVALSPVIFYVNALWLIPRFLKKKTWYRYFLIGGGLLGTAELLRVLIYASLKASDHSFGDEVWTEISSNASLLVGFPNFTFLALLFSFGYRFTKDWVTHQKTIEKLRTEKISMELGLLKSQMDPHFLFNNLNALDDLIDRDKEQAKAYLHRLSKIYRYNTTNMQRDVVTLIEEWAFIDDYIYLLEERFGVAYRFEKENTLGDLNHYLIPPAALQSLLENAVKHNQGSLEDPLKVSIVANEKCITVSHTKRLKPTTRSSLGTGLKNLRSRYELLSKQSIEVQDGETFTVTLPLLKALS